MKYIAKEKLSTEQLFLYFMRPRGHFFGILEYNSYVARSLIPYIDNICGYSELFDSGVTLNSKILISNLPR